MMVMAPPSASEPGRGHAPAPRLRDLVKEATCSCATCRRRVTTGFLIRNSSSPSSQHRHGPGQSSHSGPKAQQLPARSARPRPGRSGRRGGRGEGGNGRAEPRFLSEVTSTSSHREQAGEPLGNQQHL